MKKKKRRIWPILLILILLLAIAAGVVFFLGSRGGGAELDTSVQPSPLLLQASQTEFRLAKGTQTELTVTAREATQGTVTIRDDRGEELLTMELQEADGKGVATGLLPVFETEPRRIELTASMGDEQSQPLSLYVTPEVTIDMIAECMGVADDLSQVLIDQGFTTVDQAALDAAEEWLSKESRVDYYQRSEGYILYFTQDGITGLCSLSREKGAFGSGFTQNEENDAVQTYTVGPDAADDKYIFSSGTLTNDRVLVLRPMYDANAMWYWDSMDNEEREDVFIENFNPCHTSVHARVGNDVAEFLGSDEAVIRSNGDAVQAIINQEINDYGVILMNTHGSLLTVKEDDFNPNLYRDRNVWCVMLQDGCTADALDGTLKERAQQLMDVCGLDPEGYSMFFGSYKKAHANPNDIRLFINSGLSLDEIAAEKDKGAQTVYTNVELYGTINMFRGLYQDRFFDNTLMYFGVCYSMADLDAMQFFLDRGAVAYCGYEGKTVNIIESEQVSNFFDLMMYSGNLKSSCDYGNVFTTLKLKEWVAFFEVTKEGNQHVIAVSEFPEYTLKDKGKLRGRVATDEEGKQPVEGANVTLYRWLDQKFIPVDETETKRDGTFEFNKVLWGVYVAQVTTDEGTSAVASCILSEKELDGGIIVVAEQSPYYPYIRDVLEPQLGLFELGEKTGTAYIMMDYNWDDRTGILSAAIEDMNNDGVEDMVLLRVEKEAYQGRGTVRQILYADMYTIEKGKVILKNTVFLDDFNNCENHEFWAAMYPTDTGCDFFFQSYSKGCLVDYEYPLYGRYSFNGQSLNPVFRVEQSSGGTDSTAGYTVVAWNEGAKKEVETPLPWLLDVDKEFHKWLPGKLDVEIQSSIEGFPSYIGALDLQSVAVIGNSGSPMGGEFVMGVQDDTGLREQLDALNMKSK